MKHIKSMAEQSSALYAQYSALTDAHNKLRSDLSAKDTESYREEERQMEVLGQRKEKAIAKTKETMNAAIREYEKLRNEVHAYIDKYAHYASDSLKDYTPKPKELNREAVEELCRKIDKNDFLSLAKRNLKVGGFGAKEDLAQELLPQLMDAVAYCNLQIEKAKNQQQIDQLRAEAKYTKQISDQMVAWHEYHTKADKSRKVKLASSQKKIREFLDSEQMHTFTLQAQQLHAQALVDTPWDHYSCPGTMPEKVRLINVKQALAASVPDPKTSDLTFRLQETILPVDLELYRNHILVFTADPQNVIGSDSIARLIAHRFLARLLKELPLENCRCALADLAGMGFNLSPLRYVEDIPGLSWSMITNPKEAAADRKAFLDFQNSVTRDMLISGKTLFEAARTENELRHPLSWYADFSYPGNPGEDLRADLAAMMKSASITGTSFLFVTTEQGLRQIRQMAKPYSGLELIHIDCVSKCLRLDGGNYPLVLDEEPDNTKIREFVRSVKPL